MYISHELKKNNTMTEIFKTHPTLGIEVSNLGRVIIPKTTNHPEHITYGSTDTHGYKHIKFNKKTYSVHRLVAETFIENPHHLPCVNHKDENKSNNNVENLEWCSHRYNTIYGTCQQRKSEKTRNDPNRSKTVYQYDMQGNLVNVWCSTRECGRNGFDQGTVAACCRGEQKTHKGYIWSYEEK